MKSSKDRYSGEIKVLFPIFGKAEKDFLKKLVVRIDEFENDHEEASYESFIEEFGMPTEIVSAYYESIDFEYLLHKMKVRNMVKKVLLIIMALSIMVCIWLINLIVFSYQESMDSAITEVETIITEECK